MASVMTTTNRAYCPFQNVGLNEAIWCTIFHHVKHLTACLLAAFFFFFFFLLFFFLL